jgi:hypothetical protein
VLEHEASIAPLDLHLEILAINRLGMVVDAVYAGTLSLRAHGRIIHVFTNDRTVLATLRSPVRKSVQALVGRFWNM